jgi:hypothetical protein
MMVMLLFRRVGNALSSLYRGSEVLLPQTRSASYTSRSLNRKWAMALLVGAVCISASCEVLGIEDDLTVALSPRSLTLSVGDTAKVSYSVIGGESGSVYSRLTSASPEVATVVPLDRIVAKGVGSTYLVLSAWTGGNGSGRDSIMVEVR